MAVALARVVLRSVLLLAVASAAVFAATEVLPGDAAQLRAGGHADPEQVAALRETIGLDRPAWQRYPLWVAGLLRGNAGRSLISDRTVAELVTQRLPATLVLSVAALVVTVPLVLGLGWLAARGPRAVRAPATALVTFGAAVPQVVVAAALVALVAGALRLVPPVSLLPVDGSPLQRLDLLVLPVLSLALPSAAYGAGLVRGAVADAAAASHVVDAEVRGVPGWRVATRHVLPFVLAPACRVLAVVAGALVGGTTVVETLFGYAGLGELLVGAVANRDVPVVQAVALLGAAVVLTGLLLADVVAAVTDPHDRVAAQ